MPDNICFDTTGSCPHLHQLLDAERRLREAVVLALEQVRHCQRILDQFVDTRTRTARWHVPSEPLAVCGDIVLQGQYRDNRDTADCPRDSMPSSDRLTPRETQVLQLVAAGLSNRQIAEALFLSPRTIERHIANVYVKLDVHNKAEATAHVWHLDHLV